MNAVQILPLLLVAAGLTLAQVAPSDPINKPDAYPVKEPKPNKSRQRDLKGFVRDETDNAVEGAIVSLKDLKTGKIVSFRTRPDGSYLFYDLNMDLDYELTAKADNFTDPVMKKLTHYDTRKPATLNFQLTRKKAS